MFQPSYEAACKQAQFLADLRGHDYIVFTDASGNWRVEPRGSVNPGDAEVLQPRHTKAEFWCLWSEIQQRWYFVNDRGLIEVPSLHDAVKIGYQWYGLAEVNFECVYSQSDFMHYVRCFVDKESFTTNVLDS